MPSGKIVSTVNNFLEDADALCKIIKVCANTNITELKVGALSMAFGVRDQSTKPLDVVETKSVEQAITISDEARRRENAAKLEDELENLKLTDPLAYERLLAGGELEDVGSSP